MRLISDATRFRAVPSNDGEPAAMGRMEKVKTIDQSPAAVEENYEGVPFLAVLEEMFGCAVVDGKS